MREIHLLPLLCPPFTSVFYLAEPPESGDKSGLVQEDRGEPLAWLHSPGHLPTAPAFSSSGEDSKKTGVPQVLWMLLAAHVPFPPGWTTLSITTLPGVAQQKVTMSFKAL